MSDCDTCTDAISCDACSSGYGYQDSKCILCPDTGKFYSNGDCIDCISNCGSCTDAVTCDACSNGYGYQNSECLTCPDTGKFYEDGNCNGIFFIRLTVGFICNLRLYVKLRHMY